MGGGGGNEEKKPVLRAPISVLRSVQRLRASQQQAAPVISQIPTNNSLGDVNEPSLFKFNIVGSDKYKIIDNTQDLKGETGSKIHLNNNFLGNSVNRQDMLSRVNMLSKPIRKLDGPKLNKRQVKKEIRDQV